MPLTPEDVVRKTFHTARFRGYRSDEVDAFLEEVVTELRRLQGQIDELRASAAERGQGAGPSPVLETERAQLDQIRRERADLVAQLGNLQEEYDRLRAGAQQRPTGDEGPSATDEGAD